MKPDEGLETGSDDQMIKKSRAENAWDRTHKWPTLSFRIVKKNNSTMLDRASPSIAPHIVAEWIFIVWV